MKIENKICQIIKYFAEKSKGIGSILGGAGIVLPVLLE